MNIAALLFVVTEIVPVSDWYVPVKTIVALAGRLCVWAAGVEYPVTAPYVIVYDPTGASLWVNEVPLPE